MNDISEAVGIDDWVFSDGVWGNGISFYDWDWDGYDDLVILTDYYGIQFYKNNQGFFEEVFFDIEISGDPKSVCWIDYNNDGTPDLAVSQSNGPFKLFRNDGDFQFADVSEMSGIAQFNCQGYGQAWADYDEDGFLDLYLSIYNNPILLADTTNFLYKNNGDGTFTDVTEFAGVGNDFRPTFLSIWADFDKDGLLDIYLINDRIDHPNYLYKNSGDGTFTDYSMESNLSDNYDAMCATIGDFNNDGWLDLYVTNTSEDGGNHLYKNNGNGTFSNIGPQSGVEMMSWCWGSAFFDFDGDKRQDLIVANSVGFFNNNDISLFKNIGLGFEHTTDGDLFGTTGFSYAFAKGDYNNDGKPEIFSNGTYPQGAKLWKAQGYEYNYLKIAIKGAANNRDAIGSHIQVFSEGVMQTQFTVSSEQYISQNSQWHFFSLGNEQQADSVIITWPNSQVEKFYNIQANQNLIIEENTTLNVQLTLNQQPFLCEGDSLIIDAGIWDSYFWNTSETTQSIIVYEPGNYFVRVYQDDNSANSDTITVQFFEPEEISYEIIQPSCYASTNGSVSLLNENNVVIDNVLWNNSLIASELTGLSSSLIEFEFTDSNGCLITGSFDIEAPDSIMLDLLVNLSEPLDLCPNRWNGSAEIQGGIPPFNVNWEFFILGSIEPFESIESSSFSCLEINQPSVAKCIVTDNNNCITFKETIIQATTISEASQEHLLLFPNPISDELFFNLLGQSGVIRIYDLSGRLLFGEKITSDISSINTKWLNAGSYIVELLTGDSATREVIIKK